MRESAAFGGNMLTIAQPKSEARATAETEAPSLSNLYGFDEDIDLDESSPALENLSISIGDKSTLAEKKRDLKRFLRNPQPEASRKGSPKKCDSPRKAMRVADIFGEASNAQRDIRWAMQPNKNQAAVDHGSNLFSDTETERVNFIWILFTKPTVLY